MKKINLILIIVALILSANITAINFNNLIPPENNDIEKTAGYKKNEVDERTKIAIAKVDNSSVTLDDLWKGKKILVYDPPENLPIPEPSKSLMVLQTQLNQYLALYNKVISDTPSDYYGNYISKGFTMGQDGYYSESFSQSLYSYLNIMGDIQSYNRAVGDMIYILRKIPYFPIAENNSPVVANRNVFDGSIRYSKFLFNFKAKFPYSISTSYDSLVEKNGISGYGWTFNFEKEIRKYNRIDENNHLILTNGRGRGILFEPHPLDSSPQPHTWIPIDRTKNIVKIERYNATTPEEYKITYKNGLIETYHTLEGTVNFKPENIKLQSESNITETIRKTVLVQIEDRAETKNVIRIDYDSELRPSIIQTNQRAGGTYFTIFEIFYGSNKMVSRIRDYYGRNCYFYYNDENLIRIVDYGGRSVNFGYGHYGDDTAFSNHFLNSITLNDDSYPVRKFESDSSYIYYKNGPDGLPIYTKYLFGSGWGYDQYQKWIKYNLYRYTDHTTYSENSYKFKYDFNKFGTAEKIINIDGAQVPLSLSRQARKLDLLPETVFDSSKEQYQTKGSAGGGWSPEPNPVPDWGSFPAFNTDGSSSTGDNNEAINIPNQNDTDEGTQIAYNSGGNVTNIKDSYENITTGTYSDIEFPYPNRITDRNGNATTLYWDEDRWRLNSITYPNGRNKQFSYDSRGNLITESESGSYITNYTYDARSNLLEKQRGGEINTIDSDGNNVTQNIDEVVTYTYDTYGNILTKNLNNELTDSYTYNNYNRITSRNSYKAEGNETVTYQYDNKGNLVWLRDGEGNITNYAYDMGSKLIEKRYPLTIERYIYSPDGNIIEKSIELKSDATKKEITRYNYDSFYDSIKLQAIFFDPDRYDKTKREFNYDNEGNIITIFDFYKDGSQIKKEYTYDLLNRAANVKTYFEDKVFNLDYTYDNNGNALTRTFPYISGSPDIVSMQYDVMNRVTEMNYPNIGVFSYTYTTCCGMLDSVTYPNGKVINYNYDDLKNLKSIENPYAAYNYYVDERGNRTGMIEKFGQSDNLGEKLIGKELRNYYWYDNQNQLIGASYYNGAGQTFGYDKVGNRTRSSFFTLENKNFEGVHVPAGTYRTERYQYDGENRLDKMDAIFNSGTVYDAKNWDYNFKGEVLEERDENNVIQNGNQYDPEGRLLKVIKGGRIIGQYLFSPTGERLKRTYIKPNDDTYTPITEYYVYDGANCVYDYTESWQKKKTYYNGPGVDNIMAFKDNGLNKSYYLFKDALGSTRQIIRADTDELIASYGYGAWGEITDYTEDKGYITRYEAEPEQLALGGSDFKVDPIFNGSLYYLRGDLLTCDMGLSIDGDTINPNKSIWQFGNELVKKMEGDPGLLLPETDSFTPISNFFRRDGNIYKKISDDNCLLMKENINKENYTAPDNNYIYTYNNTDGFQKVSVNTTVISKAYTDEIDNISPSQIEYFDVLIRDGSFIYFTAKLTGDTHINIYKIDSDLSHTRLTDDTDDYVNIKVSNDTFAVLKGNYDSGIMDLIIYNFGTGEEKVIANNIDNNTYEPIGWNEDGTLFVYDIKTSAESGLACSDYPDPPVDHHVRKKVIEIFACFLPTSNLEPPTSVFVFDLGEYNTVMDSMPSLGRLDDKDYIFYSRYENDHSNICKIPIEYITTTTVFYEDVKSGTPFSYHYGGSGFMVDPIFYGSLYYLKGSLLTCDMGIPLMEDAISLDKSIWQNDIELVPTAQSQQAGQFLIPPATDSFFPNGQFFRRDDNVYKRMGEDNYLLMKENINKGNYIAPFSNYIYTYNNTDGIERIVLGADTTIATYGIIPAAEIQSFDTIKYNSVATYFTAKLTGDNYINIYRINSDLTYDRLTDDLAVYTKIEPMKNSEAFAVLKTDVPAMYANLILLNPETNEEKTIAMDIDPNNYEAIKWNFDGSLFIYDIKTGEEPGTACPYQFAPVNHYVRKKIIEMYAYCSTNEKTFDLGSYETVFNSKPDFSFITNNFSNIFYSKYLSDHSDIYRIPLEYTTTTLVEYSIETGTVETLIDDPYFKNSSVYYSDNNSLYYRNSDLLTCDMGLPIDEDTIDPDQSIWNYDLTSGNTLEVIPQISADTPAGTLAPETDSFIKNGNGYYYRRDGNLCRKISYNNETGEYQYISVKEDVGKKNFIVLSENEVFVYSLESGLQKIIVHMSWEIFYSSVTNNIIPGTEIEDFDVIRHNSIATYFTAKLAGDNHINIYKLSDPAYTRLTDDAVDYTKIEPMKERECFTALRGSDGTKLLVILDIENNKETTIKSGIDSNNYEPIGWNDSNGQLTIDNGQLFVWSIKTGEVSGLACSDYPEPPVNHYVKKKIIEIYGYYTGNSTIFNFGKYNTVMDSSPSIGRYNNQDHIFYSKYKQDHSAIYRIPLKKTKTLAAPLDIFDYDKWSKTYKSGKEIPILEDDTFKVDPCYNSGSNYLYYLKGGMLTCDMGIPLMEDAISLDKSIWQNDLELVPTAQSQQAGQFLVPPATDSFFPTGRFFRRDNNVYKRLGEDNYLLMKENVAKGNFVGFTPVFIYSYNNTDGFQRVSVNTTVVSNAYTDKINAILPSQIEDFDCLINSKDGSIYFTAKLSGDNHINIYLLNDDLSYNRLTDDNADYTNIQKGNGHFAVLKTDGSNITNLVLLNPTTNEEKIIVHNINPNNYEAIGWNDSNGQLTIDNGQLFVWSIKTGEEPGLACSDYPDPPVNDYVAKKIIEIYLYYTENNSVYDLGSYETLLDSSPSIARYNDQDYIIYSKYLSDHSDIHRIPIEYVTKTVVSVDVETEIPISEDNTFKVDPRYNSGNNYLYYLKSGMLTCDMGIPMREDSIDQNRSIWQDNTELVPAIPSDPMQLPHLLPATDSFFPIGQFFRRDNNVYKRLGTNNYLLMKENISAGNFTAPSSDYIYTYNNTDGLKKIIGTTPTQYSIIPAAQIQSFDTIKYNSLATYFTAKLTGDTHINIYKLSNLTYTRLTDDLANYTNLEPMKNSQIFAVLKTDVPAVSANLILLNPETNEEKTIAVDINPNNYGPIGWNDSNGQLTIDNGQLFVWSIKTGEEAGTTCPYQFSPVNHKVRKKIIEIFAYYTENDTTFDLGSYETVFNSKPSIAMSNGSDHIFYSKYGATHSDIYVIPLKYITETIIVDVQAGMENYILEDSNFKIAPIYYNDDNSIYYLNGDIITCDSGSSTSDEDHISPEKSVWKYDFASEDKSEIIPNTGKIDSFIKNEGDYYYRKDGDLYKKSVTGNYNLLVKENIDTHSFIVPVKNNVFIYSLESGLQKIVIRVSEEILYSSGTNNIIPGTEIESFDTIKHNIRGTYFTAKLTGDTHYNIYYINSDRTYDRLTDDLADYTNLELMKNNEIFAVLKTDVPAMYANLVILNPATNEENIVVNNINPNNYQSIGWNDSNGQLTMDNGQLFVWSIKTGEEPGLACSDYPDPNIQPQPPIDHHVRKKIIRIFVYCTENNSTFDLGEYETVKDSRPSIAKYNDQDHIFYSKYLSDHSDIYAIPIVEDEEQINVFGYSNDIADTGVVVTNSDERARLMKLNLSPYRKKLDKEPVIRYLFTGREYNVETGDYYYRARVMDASVGRFTGKDSYFSLNRYFYTDDDPVNYTDPMGKVTIKIGLSGFLGALVGGHTETGIAIGISKECGLSFGTYSEAGAGATFPASASAGISVTVGTQKSVGELGGEYIATGGSAGGGFGWGGELVTSGTGIGGTFTFGFGIGAEGHSHVGDTQVNVKKKGKCKD